MPKSKRLLANFLVAIVAVVGATSTPIVTQAQALRPCSRCNIVQEGLWNQGLISQTIYLYSRPDNDFYPVVVTGIHREGPFYVINWRDPNSGRQGKDDATSYYSYRSMQEIVSSRQSSPPPLSQSESQEKTAWLASCAMARSDNVAMRFLGLRACCESTAAQRYGPDAICR